MSVSLDELQVSDSNKGGLIPALHPSRIEKTHFLPYKAPPVDTNEQADYEEWFERLQFIAEDLHWLLQQPHDKFWCQVVFDNKLHALLDSYLRFAPRSYDIIYDLPEKGREKHKEVHRLIFMTSLRLATHKESKEKFITPKIFGEILYENFLFDIPKLFDLCILYGKGNAQLLSKMISNIFIQQPKYNDDLRATIPTILQVFDNVVAKCHLETDYSSAEPKKLGNIHSSDTLLTISTSDFQDILFYIVDIGNTLSIFLDIYPEACQIFHEFHFEQRLAKFYELIIPELVLAVKSRSFTSVSHLYLMKQKLHQGKLSLQKIFNSIMTHTCIQPLLENSDEDQMESCVEDFLHTWSAILGERRFLADYECNFSFQDILDIFSQSECPVDDEQLQYIRGAVNSAFATYGKRKKPSGATTTGGRTSPDGSPGPPDEKGAVGGACGGGATASWGGAGVGEESGASTSYSGDAYQVEDYNGTSPAAPSVSPVEFESMISAVKDLLPDLGEGFIELALEELNYSVERVINCILEEKLPPSLQELDRSLPREPIAPEPELLVESRRNIYDGDEFDVFRRENVDMSRIHQGKKEEKIAFTDKKFIKEMKATYDAYGAEDAESLYDNILYDDEYDDTYDINNVGAADADSADELTSRRQFITPRVFQSKDTRGADEDSDSDESGSESKATAETVPRIKGQFVSDPAKLREAAAQRRATKVAKRGGRPGPPPRNNDVEGKAKGQGQSDDVNRNRSYKDKHKSSRANHNRKDMADRKRKV